jgi:hypothetical protein
MQPEYKAYNNAKQRCTNPRHRSWKNYGGRGIKFLFVSFEQFLAEVGLKPKSKRRYSLDRVHNEGNYEPGNVRWATDEEQWKTQRRRSYFVLSIEVARVLRKQFATGKHKIAELARVYNVDWHTIESAIKGKSWKETHV